MTRAKIDTMRRRIDAILTAIHERYKPKPIVPLPTVWLTLEGEDQSGYEESNAQSYRQAELMGVAAKVYLFNPDEEGTEP